LDYRLGIGKIGTSFAEKKIISVKK